MRPLTDDVMNDLLTVYLAGEASADTRAMVDAHARENPAFGARMAAAGAVAVPDVSGGRVTGDHELRALARTRQFIRLRTIFCAAAVWFTLMPLSFRGGTDGVEFLLLGRQPGLVWAFWSLAAASWTAWYVMHRSIRRAGI
jgi:anti-sigma factor RsiW